MERVRKLQRKVTQNYGLRSTDPKAVVKDPVGRGLRVGLIQSCGKGPRGNGSDAAALDSRPLREEAGDGEQVRKRLTCEVMFWSLTTTWDWTRPPRMLWRGT